jgi:hypothetical protein
MKLNIRKLATWEFMTKVTGLPKGHLKLALWMTLGGVLLFIGCLVIFTCITEQPSASYSLMGLMGVFAVYIIVLIFKSINWLMPEQSNQTP